MPVDASSAAAEIERQVQAVNELHQALLSQCFTKCIATPPHDDDLAMGEVVCLDRCVGKFLETFALVGTEVDGKPSTPK